MVRKIKCSGLFHVLVSHTRLCAVSTMHLLVCWSTISCWRWWVKFHRTVTRDILKSFTIFRCKCNFPCYDSLTCLVCRVVNNQFVLSLRLLWVLGVCLWLGLWHMMVWWCVVTVWVVWRGTWWGAQCVKGQFMVTIPSQKSSWNLPCTTALLHDSGACLSAALLMNIVMTRKSCHLQWQKPRLIACISVILV